MLMFRQLHAFTRGLFAPAIEPMDSFLMHSRVWPTDLNLGGHMDNVRYLKLMDIARVGFFTASGIAAPAGKARITPVPVVGATHIRYRRPMHLWQGFTLETRILCWDEKWLFLEQNLKRGKTSASEALVKCIFLRNDRPVPPGEVLALTGQAPDTPPSMPSRVRQWLATDQQPVTDRAA